MEIQLANRPPKATAAVVDGRQFAPSIRHRCTTGTTCFVMTVGAPPILAPSGHKGQLREIREESTESLAPLLRVCFNAAPSMLTASPTTQVPPDSGG